MTTNNIYQTNIVLDIYILDSRIQSEYPKIIESLSKKTLAMLDNLRPMRKVI